MKNKIILFSFLLLFATFSVFSQSQTKEAAIKTKIYCDHCKECESCQARIEHELNYTKGVKSFSLDVEKELITVTYQPAKTDIDKIREAINKAGFDADDKMAAPEYVSKLDDCCRKVN